MSVVAVASGVGLAEALRSMGAGEIVGDGGGANPSVAELVDAVERCEGGEVLLLPNDPNLLLAAREASTLTTKRAVVVPSRSALHGLAALQAFHPDVSPADNAERMTRAMARVRSVAIASAVRDAEAEGVTVRAGETVGLIDGRPVASGRDAGQVLQCALDSAGAGDAELITLFVGKDVDWADARQTRDAVASWYPGATVELHSGGQPHYRYLVAVE